MCCGAGDESILGRNKYLYKIRDREMRRIQIGVNQTGSDRFYSNYMVHDTKEKLLEYLQKEETKEELIGCYKHLSDRADED